MADGYSPLLAAYELVPPVELFRLPHSGVNNRTMGVRTGAGEFVWKVYTSGGDMAGIIYEHRLLAWLGSNRCSFGVPVPLPARSGETVSAMDGGWQALFVRLAGTRPDSSSPAHASSVGDALGQLHTALARYPVAKRPGVSPFGDMQRVHARVPDPFNLTPHDLSLLDRPPYNALLGWWRAELAALRSFANGAYRALPWQVIHGDFAPSNTLLGAGRVSAVLDFEFALPDARALDLASGLHFSMRVLENPEPWQVARRFCQGYGRWIRLTEAEVAAVPWLMRLRNAVSSVWWLGRGLAAGNVSPAVECMRSAQGVAGWLRIHEQRLLELIGSEASP